MEFDRLSNKQKIQTNINGNNFSLKTKTEKWIPRSHISMEKVIKMNGVIEKEMVEKGREIC